jgi:hypothetical protein
MYKQPNSHSMMQSQLISLCRLVFDARKRKCDVMERRPFVRRVRGLTRFVNMQNPRGGEARARG